MSGRLFLEPTEDRLNTMYRNDMRRKRGHVEPDETIPDDREDLRRYYAFQLRQGDTSLLDDDMPRPVGG